MLIFEKIKNDLRCWRYTVLRYIYFTGTKRECCSVLVENRAKLRKPFLKHIEAQNSYGKIIYNELQINGSSRVV